MTGPFGTGEFGTGIFSTSPLFTTPNIIDSVLRDTGHSNPSTETTKREVVLRFINNRYAYVTTSQHWNWMFQTLDTNFHAPYTTGTIDVTNGSEIVTGTGTAFDVNLVPENVLLIGDERYVIETLDSPTEMILQGEFAGDTQTGLSYKAGKPTYTMPSDLEAVQSIVVYGQGELVPKGTQEFRRIVANNPTLLGAPVFFTEIGRRSEDGVRYIEVYPIPDRDYAARVEYGVNIMKLTDSDDLYPLIPDRHRVVLYYGALAEMYRFLKDFNAAESAERDFQRALLNMRNDKQLTDSRLILQPGKKYRRGSGSMRAGVTRDSFSREG